MGKTSDTGVALRQLSEQERTQRLSSAYRRGFTLKLSSLFVSFFILIAVKLKLNSVLWNSAASPGHVVTVDQNMF